MNPTCEQIANSFHLWGEYVDPMATMTEAEFDAMSAEERVEMIHSTFPGECSCPNTVICPGCGEERDADDATEAACVSCGICTICRPTAGGCGASDRCEKCD